MPFRSILTLGLITICFSFCLAQQASSHRGLPVIQSHDKQVDYRVGTDWVYGQWGVAPQIENDTLIITCYRPEEAFLFKTDIDSIAFKLRPGSVEQFYVQVGKDQFAHTIITAQAFSTEAITHLETDYNDQLAIRYQEQHCDYLEKLKKKYPLDELLAGAETDQERVLRVLNWTHHQWQHDGNNAPKKNDALSILDEVQEGARFPCFAYAIVLRDQLTTLGYKARTIYLKTADAATRKGSPGHVATEVYLNDQNKWVFVDGQFNIMPSLDGKPLNAVELQQAISNDYKAFQLETSSPEPIVSKRNYVDFVYDYLFYLDTSLDNRYDRDERFLVEGKRSMMLVPMGAEDLTHIDFWDMAVDYCVYTKSVQDFYANPTK
ncbi:MAG: hypothetical protein KTR30_00880 [Saprospiraceae bacterium]|nr:hypothetical protein [Saprospiraceae bacterium]